MIVEVLIKNIEIYQTLKSNESAKKLLIYSYNQIIRRFCFLESNIFFYRNSVYLLDRYKQEIV